MVFSFFRSSHHNLCEVTSGGVSHVTTKTAGSFVAAVSIESGALALHLAFSVILSRDAHHPRSRHIN